MSYQGFKCLIVDDSAISRRANILVCEEIGLNICAQAANGIEALQHMHNQVFDLVLIDFIMPEMDGLELYQVIKQKYPEQKCIFVSALGGDHNFLASVQDRIPGWMILKKPLDPNALDRCIIQHLSSSADDEMAFQPQKN